MLAPRTDTAATRITAAAAFFLWLLLSYPLLSGRSAIYFRDTFNLFLPLKAYGAEQLTAGRVPAVNTSWGLGQPFRGNPNAAAFYPGNLLYLLLPFWPAWGSHFALHWLLSALTMAALSRKLGSSRAAAGLAALAYAGSGWMLSVLTFNTTLVVVAWWPLVIWGAVRGGRRGIAVGSLACGLAILGGEPVLAALGFLPVVVFAVWRAGLRRGFGRALALAVGGAVVALPQIVALARVLPYSFRASHGLPAGQVGAYAFDPARLLELIAPFPFGVPLTETAGLGNGSADLPYFLSIFFGLVALLLALNARPRPRGEAVAIDAFRPCAGLALSAIVLAWAGGPLALPLRALTLGLFRYPEKTLFWLALTLPLLAAMGFDRARRSRIGWRPWWLVAGTIVAALVILLVIRPESIAPSIRAHLNRQLIVALLTLALAAWAVLRGKTQYLLAIQLVSLLQLYPLWLTDDTSFYREPQGLAARLEGNEAVVPVRLLYPPWPPWPPWEDTDGAGAGQGPFAAAHSARSNALAIAQGPGVLHGFTYPAAPDVEGLHHVFFHFALFWTSQATWPERLAWSRQLGVEAITTDQLLPRELGLEPAAAIEMDGDVTRLYRPESSRELAWWPRSVQVASSPRHAFELVAARSRPDESVALPFTLEHSADGRLTATEHSPDRMSLEISSQGGVAVVRRAFQPFWKATIDGKPLRTFPVDLTFLGIEVPAGTHRLELAIDSKPEVLALVAAVLAVFLFLGAIFTRRRSDEPPRSM